MDGFQKVSRRRLLRLISATSTITSISTVSAKQVKTDLPKISVEEITGADRLNLIKQSMNTQSWASIEEKLINDKRVRPDLQSATATKVTEQNGDHRHVISVPYIPYRSQNEGREIFIQSYGFHQMEEQPQYKHNSFPDFAGYEFQDSKKGSESDGYYVRDGSLFNSSFSEGDFTDPILTNSGYTDMWYPLPPSGECDNCKAETGVGCTPDRECLSRIVGIVAGGIGCAACAYAPSWANPACWACVLSGISQGLAGSMDCLGCDEIKEVCITDEYADMMCDIT